ncbi:MAG: VWA domain-containing protein [Bdellovibrionales bacterium]|nr:VWA domain-containing protein [Bdellovibrionales bacterium]
MFRFANPEYLNLLYLLLALVVLAIIVDRKKVKKMMSTFGKTNYLFLAQNISKIKRRIKFILKIGALLFFIIALARPQTSGDEVDVKSQGVEMMFAVDISNSMLAEDIKPSRLEMTKKEIERMIDQLGGDKVGIVAFAGSAVLLSPLTTDKAALKMYLDSLTPDAIGTQGTNFNRAIEVSTEALLRGGLTNSEGAAVTKVIVVFSDGENNEGSYESAVEKASDQGIKVFGMAVGTEKGAPIPIRDQYGQLKGYLKDQSNKVVMSKTSGETLRKIAQKGSGEFYYLTYGGATVKELIQDVAKLEQQTFEEARVANFNEQFIWPLSLALIFLLLDLLISETKMLGRWKGRFEVNR